MNVCYLECEDWIVEVIRGTALFKDVNLFRVELPLTAIVESIDILIVGPLEVSLLPLIESMSDWEIPPVTLCVLDCEDFDAMVERMRYLPRVGRSFHFCRNTKDEIEAGLPQVHQFHMRRNELDELIRYRQLYAVNNVSPRWLFHSLMEHLEDYVYFKDRDARFLAVSRYFVEQTHRDHPHDVLGLTDFDILNLEHARQASQDESAIMSRRIAELHKEERVKWNEHNTWVFSRKMPLLNQEEQVVGTFGISRDVTVQKEQELRLRANSEHIISELNLARSLQEALLGVNDEPLISPAGCLQFEYSTKYIPSFHLSGDFYALVQVPGQGGAVLVADVMGHGVRSAMVMAMIQVAVRQFHQYVKTPAKFMYHLNSLLFQSVNQQEHTLFATAIFCYIDLQHAQLKYVQSGSRHGILSRGGEFHNLSGPIGSALGLLPGSTYQETQTSIAPGDRVLLYTNGLIEAAEKGEFDANFGTEGVKQSMRKYAGRDLQRALDGLLEDVMVHQKRCEMADDICLFLFQINEPDGESAAALEAEKAKA